MGVDVPEGGDGSEGSRPQTSFKFSPQKGSSVGILDLGHSLAEVRSEPLSSTFTPFAKSRCAPESSTGVGVLGDPSPFEVAEAASLTVCTPFRGWQSCEAQHMKGCKWGSVVYQGGAASLKVGTH